MKITYYNNLYIDTKLMKKKEQLKEQLEKNEWHSHMHLIILAKEAQNHLEFFSTRMLKQEVFAPTTLFVVGFAAGYDEAREMVRDIVEEVYQKTGSVDIRRFLLEHSERGF